MHHTHTHTPFEHYQESFFKLWYVWKYWKETTLGGGPERDHAVAISKEISVLLFFRTYFFLSLNRNGFCIAVTIAA